MANIKFVPPQMGPFTQFSTRALRSGPLWLLIKDAGVLLTVLPYLPLLFFPRNTKAKDDKEKTALLCVLLLRLIAWPTQGSRILYSAESISSPRTADQHPHERWVFINGICTGSSGLQANIDRLSLLFGRQVVGIHNQSVGMLSDLLECLFQRCLSYHTMDVRVACEILKEYLVDEEVKKLVLVAHSQGGIIASMAVDALVTELPANVIGKLEIYTFGSAASHFHNPPSASTSDITSHASGLQSNIIPHIEHYANEYDMVPRWGVLYVMSNLLNNRYAGSVFVRAGASGHMFVDHYLDPIFPLPRPRKLTPNTSIQQKHAIGNGHDGRVEEALSYLDAVVDVDEAIPVKRQNSAPVKPLVQIKARVDPGTATSQGIPAIDSNGPSSSHGAVNGYGTNDGGVVVEQRARGRTVRELSRMWLYLEGSSPEE
ncbi:MAG: hypothetical protein Q9200_002237 [Gallowayella weberi]